MLFGQPEMDEKQLYSLSDSVHRISLHLLTNRYGTILSVIVKYI